MYLEVFREHITQFLTVLKWAPVSSATPCHSVDTPTRVLCPMPSVRVRDSESSDQSYWRVSGHWTVPWLVYYDRRCSTRLRWTVGLQVNLLNFVFFWLCVPGLKDSCGQLVFIIVNRTYWGFRFPLTTTGGDQSPEDVSVDVRENTQRLKVLVKTL